MFKLFKSLFFIVVICNGMLAIGTEQKMTCDETTDNEEETQTTLAAEEHDYLQDANNCMEFRLGSSSDSNPATIYTVPSCTHCGTFLATALPEFLRQYGAIRSVRIKFIVTCSDDIRILKLFYKKFSQVSKENSALRDNIWLNMFWNYVDFMKVFVSNKLNLERVFLKFGFSQEEFNASLPDPDGYFEKAILITHSKHSDELAEANESKELDVPYILYHGKHIKTLELIEKDQSD